MSRLSHLRDSLLALAIVGLPGGLVPAWGAADTYGVNAHLGGSNSLPIGDATTEWGVRFTADESIVVDRALTYLNGYTGAPNLEIAIQADDGFGNPNGTDLGVGSVVPIASGDYTTVNLTSTSLTAGNVYHMIHRVPNGGSGNSVSIRTVSGGVQSHVNTGRPEENYAVTYRPNSSTAWNPGVSDVVTWGVYNSATNQAMGQPYAFGNSFVVGQDIWRGQSFTFTDWGSKNKVDEVSMRVYKGTENLADDLRIYLIDTTTNAALWSDVLVDKDAPLSGPAGDTFTVSVPNIALVDGRQYVLAVESEGTTAAGSAYQLMVNMTAAPAPLMQENFQYALESQYVLAFTTGIPASGFTGQDNLSLHTDAYFTVHLVPEPAALSLLAVGALVIGRRRNSMRVN